VTELRQILDKNQSNLSKHLTRLRLTGIVGGERDGVNVCYHLIEPKEKEHKELLDAVTVGLAGLDTFKRDLVSLSQVKKKSVRARQRNMR